MPTRSQKDRIRNRKIKDAEEQRKVANESSSPSPVTDDGKDEKNKASEKTSTKEQKKAKSKARRETKRQEKRRRARIDPMYSHRPLKVTIAVIAIVAMLLMSGPGIYGLFTQASDNTNWEKTGTVAATIMGDNIMEDSITQQIMSTKSSYDDDQSWAQYLVDNDLTPQSLRQQTIESYEDEIIMRHALIDNGVSTTTTQSEKDEWWEANKDQYEAYGLDEDTATQYYGSSIQTWLLTQKVAPLDGISDQEILDYLNDNSSIYNGTRKSSHILFSVSDTSSDDAENTNTDEEEVKAEKKSQADDVLKQIQDGSLSFDNAVSQYSEDTGSKDDGGNVGWDCDTTFVDAYENALKGLNDGDVSDVIESEYGYHIIKCTGVLSWDGTLDDISKVPDDIKEEVKKTLQSQKYSEWYQDYEEKAKETEQVNDMPEGLPYDVSLDGVTKSENVNSSSSTSTSTISYVDANGETVDANDTNEDTEVSDTSE